VTDLAGVGSGGRRAVIESRDPRRARRSAPDNPAEDTRPASGSPDSGEKRASYCRMEIWTQPWRLRDATERKARCRGHRASCRLLRSRAVLYLHETGRLHMCVPGGDRPRSGRRSAGPANHRLHGIPTSSTRLDAAGSGWQFEWRTLRREDPLMMRGVSRCSTRFGARPQGPGMCVVESGGALMIMSTHSCQRYRHERAANGKEVPDSRLDHRLPPIWGYFAGSVALAVGETEPVRFRVNPRCSGPFSPPLPASPGQRASIAAK
jgi:hypothetical protein